MMDGNTDFLKQNRAVIELDFSARMAAVPGIYAELIAVFAGLRPEVVLAVKYLYAHMPYSDMGNYPAEVFLDFAVHSVDLWQMSEQVRRLPEEIFLQYVLFHRVNEEEIVPCRQLFYNEIQSYVVREGYSDVLTMDARDAVLELNYWCGEQVTYESSDERTLSARAVYEKGCGRCGEESVFCVNVMRSAGIPARQVYAPRWSHCDDNHAWVEVWCDGCWYFIGACEPEPVLNRGWFTNASSRAMMIHARSFAGGMPGADVMGKEGIVTMSNELRRYALTKQICVSVTDREGKPAAGVSVDFEVLNYSEFVPVAQLDTDVRGQVTLTTGLGCLHVFAHDADWFGETILDVRAAEDACVCLDRRHLHETKALSEKWQPLDMAAPKDAPVNADRLSDAQRKAGKVRASAAAAICQRKRLVWKNAERERFLAANTGDGDSPERWRRLLLEALSAKDQTDCRQTVLEEHLQCALPFAGRYPEDIFVKFVLNPRVEDEILTAYRKPLSAYLQPETVRAMRENPAYIWQWVTEHIVSKPEGERSTLLTVPMACLKTGLGSFRSQIVLFVSIARTLGIPARKNPQTGMPEYWQDGKFLPVTAGEEKNCLLVLRAGSHADWKYGIHWTIARLQHGMFKTLYLEDDVWHGSEAELTLAPGQYRILTSNRLPNGNILANQFYICLTKDDRAEVTLALREAHLEEMLEAILLPEFTLTAVDTGALCQISEILRHGRHMLMFLEEGCEPTEHLLNELLAQRTDFSGYGSRMIFVVRSCEAVKNKTFSRVLETFADARVYVGDFGELVYMLGRRLYVDHEKLPLVTVTEDTGHICSIYAASGYQAGIGEMLLRLMKLKRSVEKSKLDTIIYKIDGQHMDTDKIAHAGKILAKGGLVAFPTETVYGLGGDAMDALAAQKIYEAKGRPSDNPLIVHIADLDSLTQVVRDVPPQAYVLAKHFWPGPLTMIMNKADRVPMATTGGLDTVAVRMPDNEIARAIIRASGTFIAAPSANTSGRPSPTLAEHVIEDMDGRIDMIIDGGKVGIGLESTIVDLTGEVPMILRPGFITEQMLADVLGAVLTDRAILAENADKNFRPKAPGMKYRHYAPKGELTIVEGAADTVVKKINEMAADMMSKGHKVAVIAANETKDEYRCDHVFGIGSRTHEETIAANLFEILRDMDAMSMDVIFSESFDDAGLGQAIMNRLLKAAGHHVIRADETI